MIDMKPTFSHFNITAWLISQGIPFSTEGPNISRKGDWIGINCPFCTSPDPSDHLGINLNSKAIKCLRCDTKGTIIRLMMKLLRLPYDDVIEIIEEQAPRQLTPRTEKERTSIPETILPLNTVDELLPAHRQYLINKNYNPDLIRDKYKIQSIGPVSNPFMENRILIPYIINNRIVTYTTRDISDQSPLRYMACSDESCTIPIDHLLYNIETVKEVAVIVEGTSDVWRMGDGFVAMGSLIWSSARLLALRHCKRVILMPDSESHAQDMWEVVSYSLTSLISDVQFASLSEGDPGQLDEETVRNFRQEIFGRIY
ncbi:hypothetical protein LCGC14_1485160 [marine sediment metagenome]|uniref:Zinc finger CHC2-type domain-containing protein n=1 Tax=marine sediment metagenome TaxID=412755 RepID=A0A0F9JU93_9ZZZZ